MGHLTPRWLLIAAWRLYNLLLVTVPALRNEFGDELKVYFRDEFERHPVPVRGFIRLYGAEIRHLILEIHRQYWLLGRFMVICCSLGVANGVLLEITTMAQIILSGVVKHAPWQKIVLGSLIDTVIVGIMIGIMWWMRRKTVAEIIVNEKTRRARQ